MGFGSDAQFTEAIAGIKPNASQEMTQQIHSSPVRNTGKKKRFVEDLKTELTHSMIYKTKSSKAVGKI